ncbi:metal-dependent hydrolase [Halovivax gelatinilyticus]|uniref:metal-dependent hydrolase n=1 Tax=Halovivax gelatinilyticus TaxID=2961597 RepID=UPI0020CA87F2|nr:metal-dependent hydrolase [Halovivax gelatinilyticus]
MGTVTLSPSVYWKGHVGTAILWYTPLYLWIATESTTLALFGLLVAVACAPLPDIDTALPVPHRGPTHTVWFLAGSIVVGSLVGGLLAPTFDVSVLIGVLAVGGAVGISLTSHVFLDALTPMGIRPFEPVAATSVSLRLVRSKNPMVNWALLIAGCVVLVGGSVSGF